MAAWSHRAADADLTRRLAAALGVSDPVAAVLARLCPDEADAERHLRPQLAHVSDPFAVGGGAESMSRSANILPTMRWGQRMNDGGVVDMMVGALTDPFDTVHMGITAENIAEKWKITREQGALSLFPAPRAHRLHRAHPWRGGDRRRSVGEGAA